MKLKAFVVSSFLVLAAVLAASAAQALTVLNHSFEQLPGGGLPLGGCGTGCSYSDGAIPGWSITGQGGQFQPGVGSGNFSYFNSLPDGPTVAYSNGGTIWQTVAETAQAGATYTLLAERGNRKDLANSRFDCPLHWCTRHLCDRDCSDRGQLGDLRGGVHRGRWGGWLAHQDRFERIGRPGGLGQRSTDGHSAAWSAATVCHRPWHCEPGPLAEETQIRVRKTGRQPRPAFDHEPSRLSCRSSARQLLGAGLGLAHSRASLKGDSAVQVGL